MNIGDMVQVLFGNTRNPEIKIGIIVGPPVKRPHAGYTFEVLIEGNVHVVMRDHIHGTMKLDKEDK
tara:strand:- start:40 stop:237 length:198 start_codon:yes stop_codon:yes gene_type:complete